MARKTVYDVFNKMFDKLLEIVDELTDEMFGHDQVFSYLDEDAKGPKVDVIVMDSDGLFHAEWERFQLDNPDASGDEIDKMLLDLMKHGWLFDKEVPAITKATLKKNDSGKVEVGKIYVYISTDEFERAVLYNMSRPKDVLDYYRLVIRHEFGHVLDIFSNVGEDYDEVMENRRHDEIMREQVMEKNRRYSSEHCHEKDEHMVCRRVYFSEVPKENRANQLANFTKDDFENYVRRCGLSIH